jgi:hypothetical protein
MKLGLREKKMFHSNRGAVEWYMYIAHRDIIIEGQFHEIDLSTT